MVIKMKHYIAAGKFKANCLQLMEQVQKTHSTFVITKRGKPVAQMIPIEENESSERKPLFGYMKGSINISGDILTPMDETWEAESD